MSQFELLVNKLGLSSRHVFNQWQRQGQTGTWLYDCDSRQYWWSDQTYRIYGLPLNSRLSIPLLKEKIHPDDIEQVKSSFLQVLNGGKCHILHRIVNGGRIRWVEQNCRLYSGAKGRSAYVAGMVRDITTLQEEKLRLESRRADLAAINNYLAETTDTTDLRSIVSSVKHTIRQRMDVSVIAVFVRQGERITRVIPRGMDPMRIFMFQDVRDFIGYHAVISGQRQFCCREEYPNLWGQEALSSAGGESVTALPIKHGRKTIGALSLVLRRRSDLSREEREFCRAICGYLSNQLYCSLLYDQLKCELALRRRLESDREVIFNESVDYISIIDSEGRFAQINPAFAKRLGQSPQALIGQSIFDFIHPEDRPYAHYTLGLLPAKGVVRGLCNRYLYGDGQVGYLENNLKYMEETGDTIAIARDVTDQRQMEALNTALEDSIAVEKMKSQLFAGISHEFKTPLNIILSSLDLLRMKSQQENPALYESSYAKYMNYAYENCFKLLRLATNLLDASRMESNYYQINPVRCELSSLLREIVASARVYAEASGIRLSYHPARQEETWLYCDEDGIDRIVLNLISNAIKNTAPGGGIDVYFQEEESVCRVTVADNGQGISPELLPCVFEKFRTEATAMSGRQGGTGLGLSLVKTLVQLHGGWITAESEPGKGSRFSFTIAKNLLPIDDGGSPARGGCLEAQRLNLAAHVKMELSNLK